MNWIKVGVVERITVVCELLTFWNTIVIVGKEVMRLEDWLGNYFFIDIVDWNISLFKLWNVWLIKSSFIFDFRRTEWLWFNECDISFVWVVIVMIWVIVMIVIVMWFQVVVAPQWVVVIVSCVVCWSYELRVLANVLGHIV